MIIKWLFKESIQKSSLILCETHFNLNKSKQGIIDCSLCKGGMEVQHMVAAVVVVVGSAVVASLCTVPDVCKLRHRGGLLLVELLQEIRVYRSAVADIHFSKLADLLRQCLALTLFNIESDIHDVTSCFSPLAAVLSVVNEMLPFC